MRRFSNWLGKQNFLVIISVFFAIVGVILAMIAGAIFLLVGMVK